MMRKFCSLRPLVQLFFALFAFVVCSASAPVANAQSSTIIISQIFGAGPDAGSPVDVKYVELFNKSRNAVTLTSDGTATGAPWSIQYSSATSMSGVISAANTFPITLPATVCTTQTSGGGCAATIPAGGYFLIAGAAGTVGNPPTVAIDQTNAMTLSETAGRVFLVSNSTSLTSTAGNTATTTAEASVVDFVGYGATTLTWDGTAQAAGLSATTGDILSNPCNYTGNNVLDFPTATTVTVNTPHDSGSPINECPATGGPPTATGSATPASQTAGFDTVLTVNVRPNAGTGIAVKANLSAFGGSSSQPLSSNASGTVFTYTLAIPNAQAVTSYSIVATVTDTQLDSIPTVTIPLTVTANVPITSIHTVQGTPPTPSSYIGQTVNISGIVTGIRSNGFYIQEPDAQADTNLATPEGIYVNTGGSAPPASVVVGNYLQVSGIVASSITTAMFPASPLEIDSPSGYGVISTGNALPTPITLTSTNFSATGAYNQLLAFQSMRMTAPSFTTVSGTSGTLNEPTETYTSNGQFYGVLTGTARPFRAAGVDIRATLPSGAPGGTTRWTPPANVLQVDSAALGVAAINLTTNSVLTPATGVLDYSTGAPLLMISSVTAERPVVTGGTSGTSASASSSTQFSVGQLNMQRFYNATGGVTGAVVLTSTDFARRLRKASAAIRNNMAFPDVVAVQEVENLATLSSLATQISSDATSNGQTDPVYVAYVGTDDSNGLANGFLVKSTKINVTGTPVTLTTTTNYTDPGNGSQPIWNEPPFLLTASVKRGTATAYPVDVVSAELLPATNINSTAVSGTSTLGASVRAQRKAQGEALAGGIQNVISGSSTTPVILACSCNAYEFSDGFVDVVGTLTGSPAAASTVVLADTPGIIPTGMTDTTTSLAAGTDRYVTIESGFADALDHILYSAATPAGTTIAAVHIDADFNVTYRNDSSTAALTTPYYTSNHDGLVATVQVPLVGAITLTPNSLTFGSQPVNSTSSPQSVLVTNTSTTTTITFTSIVASAGFGQTNNCGNSIAPNGTCTINVTFSPTSVGSPSGTITLTDSDTTGTQTITLNGSSYLLTSAITLKASANPSPAYTTETLTATVTSNIGTPIGTVQFYDGTTALGGPVTLSGGIATYSASTLTVGPHSITAVYSGSTGTPPYPAATSSALTVTVTAVDFSLQLGNTQLIIAGTAPSASTGIVVTAINSFSLPVSLACSGLPAGASCSFSPTTLTPSGGFATGTLTITSTNAENHMPHLGSESGGIAFAFTLLLAPFAFRKRRMAIRVIALLAILITGSQLLVGCGGTRSHPITNTTVTVTGTALTGTHTATITLVAQ